jgi:hypothetical protein
VNTQDESERLAKQRASALIETSTDSHPSDGHIDDPDVIDHPHEADSCQATATLRPPYLAPNSSEGMCIVAVDRRTAGPASDISNNAIAIHLGGLTGRIPPSLPEDYKMGAVICDHLDLGTSPEWLAEILGLKTVDRELKRALEAALCGVLATTVGPVDVGTVLYALGTLIHAHPCFSDVVEEATWQHRYGQHTAYRMARFGAGDSVDEAEVDACAATESPAEREGGTR